ncbi:succinyl-CoA:glutarate CoA-transferase isoform 4 [Homo sapiens]|uniref:Isoform 2 of Succinyl-CoA:glutarate CoA-transferase n=1 Tax=Homo sapiens TaxID=9606 RepID=Q9HAC7-2|nr:succinate--hydroxymethylglutarate CoA-transferase isoform 4 [Homo sapiens]
MLATLARVAALRRTCLFSGRGGGRGLWTGRPQSDMNNIKPLEGVKILDLTRVLAGPFATMNLGDLGAEVIKVERPGAGDDTRTWGPPFVGTESTYYLSVNRNKKSIAVNIKDPKGVKIIYCSITGYGQTGPISQRAGYDAVASAVSGLMHITGPENGDPVRPGVAMTDLATGLYAYGAIMAGLIQKYKTGKGLFIDCNLLSSQVACLSHIAANYLIGQKEAKRWGTAHGSIVPYQAFKTKDGYIVVGAGNNQQFATVCKILDLPELIDNSKYKTNHLRVHNRKELIKILSERFEEELTSKWLYLFEGSGVPYGPINNMKNVFAEPQNAVSGFQSLLHSLAHGPFLHLQGSARVLHNGLVMEMEHPTVGKISVPGPAVRYSKFKMSEARPPPLLGQHTTHILKEVLRYDDRAIGELLSAGVVDQHETH